MPVAFVLINTETGFDKEVLVTLREIDAVEEAHQIYGAYDLIARIAASTMGELKAIIAWKVRRLDKVRSTLTMLVMETPQTGHTMKKGNPPYPIWRALPKET